MKRIFPLLLGGLLLAIPLQGQEKPLPALYGTGTWNADSLGNHRIVVSVDKPSDAVLPSSNGDGETLIRKTRT